MSRLLMQQEVEASAAVLDAELRELWPCSEDQHGAAATPSHLYSYHLLRAVRSPEVQIERRLRQVERERRGPAEHVTVGLRDAQLLRRAGIAPVPRRGLAGSEGEFRACECLAEAERLLGVVYEHVGEADRQHRAAPEIARWLGLR